MVQVDDRLRLLSGPPGIWTASDGRVDSNVKGPPSILVAPDNSLFGESNKHLLGGQVRL